MLIFKMRAGKINNNCFVKMDTNLIFNYLLLFFCFLLITMYLTSVSADKPYVGDHIDTVEMQIGGSVNITCQMNRIFFDNQNSSCLYFSDHFNVTVPKEQMQVVDDFTIVLMALNVTEDVQYTCKCGLKALHYTNVNVGSKPTKVDFQCHGNDFASMTCNFIIPKKIYTDYKLELITQSVKHAIRLDYDIESHDPKPFKIADSHYKTDIQFYNFILNSSNVLGEYSQSIQIDQYDIVVPKTPDIHIIITGNCITLSWNVSNYALYDKYTNGLQYNTSIKQKNHPNINVDTDIQKNIDMSVTCCNLYYFMEYEVKVYVKANRTFNTKWSKPFINVFKTPSKRPDRPPKIGIGNYYIEENAIILFWEQMRENEHNGPDFRYAIVGVKKDNNELNLTMTTYNNFVSINIKFNKTSRYEFKLLSENLVGRSLNASVLEIAPGFSNITHVDQRDAITKVYNNGKYNVSWLKPPNDNLSTFTLSWCNAVPNSNNQCKGSIMFETLNKTVTHFVLEQQNVTNFALSENYFDNKYSSGVMWAMCSTNGTNLAKVKFDKNETISTEKTITIKWFTECWYMIVLDGYELTYCKYSGNCIDSRTINISNPKQNEYTIEGLERSTRYKITIRMYSKEKELGPTNNYLLKTDDNDHEFNINAIIIISVTGVTVLMIIVALGCYTAKKLYKMSQIDATYPDLDLKNSLSSESCLEFGKKLSDEHDSSSIEENNEVDDLVLRNAVCVRQNQVITRCNGDENVKVNSTHEQTGGDVLMTTSNGNENNEVHYLYVPLADIIFPCVRTDGYVSQDQLMNTTTTNENEKFEVNCLYVPTDDKLYPDVLRKTTIGEENVEVNSPNVQTDGYMSMTSSNRNKNVNLNSPHVRIDDTLRPHQSMTRSSGKENDEVNSPQVENNDYVLMTISNGDENIEANSPYVPDAEKISPSVRSGDYVCQDQLMATTSSNGDENVEVSLSHVRTDDNVYPDQVFQPQLMTASHKEQNPQVSSPLPHVRNDNYWRLDQLMTTKPIEMDDKNTMAWFRDVHSSGYIKNNI